MAKIFTLADVVFGATTIRQITNVDHRTNQEHRKAPTSGGNTISQISGKMAGEVTSVTTGDLAAVLALNSNAFVNSGASVLAGTITVPLKVRANAGGFVSGSNFVAITGSNVFAVPTQFEATQEGDMATCQMDFHWLSTDGITKGADDATGQSLAAQSFNAEFALGPAYINGSLIEGVQSVRVTPGIEVVKPPLGSGSVWPTYAMIKMVQPTIEITVNDFDAIDATVGDWTAMTSANIYFRKRSDSGVYSSSSDNVRFTFAAGLTDTNSVTISNQDDGSAVITLHGKTLTANPAVALP
jgi:hypothetical protein